MVIMHGEDKVAYIAKNGSVEVFNELWMPYDLYFETVSDDIDDLVQNLENFYHWCSTRLIHIDRKYIKEILNSIGASQQMTDRDRAKVALSYHALSLIDLYWVREDDEKTSFAEINLYDHSLSNAFTDLSLRGKSMTVENAHMIADNLNTPGMFPKAWVRDGGTFFLLKDGDQDAVEKELLASRIASCFDVPQVRYDRAEYEEMSVSRSQIITSKKYSIVTMEAFQIYALNHDMSWLDEVLTKDAEGYYMMNIIDYLVGNTDRHWGNWGWLVDNETGERVRLHDLMDFNQSFGAYDTIDGAQCQTVQGLTQREAAVDAVKKVEKWYPVRDIDDTWFGDREQWRQMFRERMEELIKL